MIPGLGGMNPKKMQSMMKQLGIKQEEIEAARVIIERADERKIVIENPSVTKIEMQGQETWQISGEVTEEEPGVSEDDVKLVSEKTGKSEEEAKRRSQEET